MSLTARVRTSLHLDDGEDRRVDYTSTANQERTGGQMDSPLFVEGQLYTNNSNSDYNEQDRFSMDRTMSIKLANQPSPSHYNQYTPSLHSPVLSQVQRPDYFHSHSADEISTINRSQLHPTQLFPSHFSPTLAREVPSYPDVAQSSSTPFDRTPQLILEHGPSSWRQPTSSDHNLRSDYDDNSTTQISPRQYRVATSNVSSASSSSNSPLLTAINATPNQNFLNRRASAPSLARDARNTARITTSSGNTPSRRRSVLSLRGQLPPGSFQLPSGTSSPYPTTGTPSFRTHSTEQDSYTPSSSSSSAGEMERLMSAAKLLDVDYDGGNVVNMPTTSQSWTPRSALREAASNYNGFENDYPPTSQNWNNSFSHSSIARPVFRQTVSSTNVPLSIPLSYPPDWAPSNYSHPHDSNVHMPSQISPVRTSNRPHSAPHISSPQDSDYYRRFSADAVNQNTLHPPRVSSSLARSNLTRQSCPTLITPPSDDAFDLAYPPTVQQPRKQNIDYSSDEFPFGHQLDPNDPYATGPKRRLSSFSDPPPPEPPIIAIKPLSKKALAAEKAQAKRDLKNGNGATRFVNYSQSDKNLLLSGVAPSGSSKRRRKEEMEADEEGDEE